MFVNTHSRTSWADIAVEEDSRRPQSIRWTAMFEWRGMVCAGFGPTKAQAVARCIDGCGQKLLEIYDTIVFKTISPLSQSVRLPLTWWTGQYRDGLVPIEMAQTAIDMMVAGGAV